MKAKIYEVVITIWYNDGSVEIRKYDGSKNVVIDRDCYDHGGIDQFEMEVIN